ncbi:MAG: DUF5666 domain-containing protein [Acidobacteriota bacterium]
MAAIIREMRPLRRAVLTTALLVGLATLGVSLKAFSAQGQNSPSQPIPFTLNGTITEQSPGKLTVDGGQNMLFTVKYDSTTQIQFDDGDPAKASDLKVGAKILTKGVLTEAGDVIAKKITIKRGSKAPSK